jgi:putative inorganic carbon (hco3(-)) transporter
MGDVAGTNARFHRGMDARGIGATLSVRTVNQERAAALLREAAFAILLTRSICDPIFNLSGGGAGSSGIGVGAVVNAIAVGVAVLLAAQRPSTSPFAVFGLWMPFLLIAATATFYAPNFILALRLAFVMLTYWAFFAIPFYVMRSEGDLTRFLLIVLASSIAPSLYAFWDLRLALGDMAGFRLQSTFSHPNIFAFYLVLMLGLALYLRTSVAVQLTRAMRTLVTAYIPLLTVFLLLTKTRSAWLTCALIFLLYGVRMNRRFLFGFLLLPLALVVDPSLLERITNITQGTEIESFSQLDENVKLNSFAWRQALWTSAIPEIVANPLLGHGLESFKPATPGFFPLIGPEGIDAHNFYLQVAFEMGLPGLLALLWLLGSLAWRLTRGLRYDRDGIMIILSILGAYALQSYSDNMQFYLSFNWYFWFVMGAICAWIERRSRLSPAPERATDSDRPGRRRAALRA